MTQAMADDDDDEFMGNNQPYAQLVFSAVGQDRQVWRLNEGDNT